MEQWSVAIAAWLDNIGASLSPIVHTRRQFLRATAATMAATAFPLRFHAAAGAGISLGFSLYGMKTVPLDEALKRCAAIGYRNVEFALNAGYPTAPQALSADA